MCVCAHAFVLFWYFFIELLLFCFDFCGHLFLRERERAREKEYNTQKGREDM